VTTNNTNNKMTRSTAATGNGSELNEMETIQMSNVFELTARQRRSAAELPLTPEFLAALDAAPQQVPAVCTVAWCVLDKNHPYDSVIPGSGELTRFHESENQASGESPSPVIVTA
jgi:hypothetical protein